MAAGVDSIFSAPVGFFEGARLYASQDYSVVTRSVETSQGEGSPALESGQETEDRSGQDGGGYQAKWTCGVCGRLCFDSLQEQRNHFRSDWHRLNVKRRVHKKPPLGEGDFEGVVQGSHTSDVESISGSDSSDSENEEGSYPQAEAGRGAKAAYLLKDGTLFAIWRCLIGGGREHLTGSPSEGELSESETITRLESLTAESSSRPWVVLLSSGGHFAGAVFEPRGGAVIAHSTFHRYVVRAKQGGRQSARDATGRAPKSGGASLRRYNEAALDNDIKGLLDTWRPYLNSAALIFVRATSFNARSLFHGDDPPLSKTDNRIRRIPFVTRRPTFSEAKRVANLLASITYEIEPLRVSENKAPPRTPPKSPPRKRLPEQAVAPQREEPAEPLEVPPPPLHLASAAGDCARVKELLEEGADPTLRDSRGRTAYSIAKDKETRNVFRRFMASHPDACDYALAQIPSPLTDEQETAQAAKKAEKAAKQKERLKERRREQREKEAAARALEQKKKAEQEAAQLAAAAAGQIRNGLSAKAALNKVKATKEDKAEALAQARATERELRAKAAELRLQSTSESPSSSSSKQGEACACCGQSLVGKTPFSRLTHQYCSTTCVRVHKQMLEDGA